MSTISKEQFLAFTEAMYLAKIQAHPISDEMGGWSFGIQDADPDKWGPGRYRLEVVGPLGKTIVAEAVPADGVQSFAARVFAEIVTAESLTAGLPINYEYLPEGIKGNLALGHVLAEHTVTSDGVVDKHITTVQLSVAHDEKDRAVHYCNDICGDLCEPGSVKILPVPLREEGGASVRKPLSRAMELADEIEEQMSALEESQSRLELTRAFAYEQYRAALHADKNNTAEIYAGVLFLVTTGMMPSADQELYGRFASFLADSVTGKGAETLPEFPAGGTDPGADRS